MTTTEKQYIEKLEELIRWAYNKNTYYDGKRVSKLFTEIASLKQQIEAEEKTEHETCDGCVCFQENGCMLDDSCPPCFEHSMWSAIDNDPFEKQEEKTVSDEYCDLCGKKMIKVDKMFYDYICKNPECDAYIKLLNNQDNDNKRQTD